MDKKNTISLQELRKDPLGFLEKVNKGNRITVIYHSKPLVTVMSADNIDYRQTKNISRMLQYADLASKNAKTSVDSNKSYKEIYAEDMAKKYGVS